MLSRLRFAAVPTGAMLDFRKLIAGMFVTCAAMAYTTPASAVEVTLDGTTTLFKDGFEGSTVGAHPGPAAVVGNWSTSQNGNSLVEVAGPGGPGPGAAAIGTKYLSLFRASEPPQSDIFVKGSFLSPAATGTLHAEWWTWIPEDIGDFGMFIGLDNSGEEFGTFARTALFTTVGGLNRVGYRRTATSWDLANMTYSYDTWQLWKVDWVLGSGQLTLTVDTTSEMLNIPDSAASPPIDHFFMRSSNFNQHYYVDGNSLEVPPPVQPGDFDGDGDVDGADFVAWQTNFPKATDATLAEGDADADGDVDGADFVVWQTNFPFTPGPAVTVPEPGSWILASLGLIGLLRFRRNKPSRS